MKHLYSPKKHGRNVTEARKESPKATLPVLPNSKQVHLIQSVLFDEREFMGSVGVKVELGQLGENFTTKEVDVLRLSKG